VDLKDLVPLITGGAGALVVFSFFTLLLVGGRLIPKSSHDEVIEGRDQIIADKDRQIAMLNRAVDAERSRSEASTVAATAAKDVLQALRQEAR
jgi:hypothetical protein